MKKSTFTTPKGLTVTVTGEIKDGVFLLRDSARTYLVSVARPAGLREPLRVSKALVTGDIEVSTSDSLVPETWRNAKNTPKPHTDTNTVPFDNTKKFTFGSFSSEE